MTINPAGLQHTKTVMQHNAIKSFRDNWNTLKKKMNFTVVARWHGNPFAHVAQQITSRLNYYYL